MDSISYTSSTEFNWEDHSYVLLRKLGPKTVELQANAAGLRSLAQQLLQIANGEIDSVFYDTNPGDLEEGSLFLQITKVQVEGRRNP